MIRNEIQPRGSGSGTTEPVGGSQGSLVSVAAPHRPASKGEKEKARALDRSASSPGYQNILNVFIKDLGQSVRLYTVYNIFRVATVAVTFAACGSSLGAPDEQLILFADNLHGYPRARSNAC